MTMHLARGLTTLNTTKKKRKITQAKLDRWKEDLRIRNKEYKKQGLHKLMMTLDEYIDYIHGEYKPKTKTETVINTPWHYSGPTVTRETKHIPSLQTSASFSPCTKKEPMQYTGERKLLGIATMHKSNMVPIFEDDSGNGKKQATEIAQMRRN